MNSREIEYMLRGNLGNWLFFAETELDIPQNKATVIWNNCHNIGKYLICESRENDSTRLFIRNVTNTLIDAFEKKGWWNTFTTTKTKTPKGIWLSKVVEYRLDRNGFLNLEVETVLPMDGIKFQKLFQSDNGTWNSIAWWLMMVCSDVFLKEYDFQRYSFYEPNYDALVERFPDANGLSEKGMGKLMLFKYLRNETTLEEIEECLNKPTDWENFVKEIQNSVANGTLDKFYGEKYPVFASKIRGNVITGDYIYRDTVERYLKRQLRQCEDLVRDNKIEAVEGNWLDKIETVLQYRKSLKDAEKAAKKEKRKKKIRNGGNQ